MVGGVGRRGKDRGGGMLNVQLDRNKTWFLSVFSIGEKIDFEYSSTRTVYLREKETFFSCKLKILSLKRQFSSSYPNRCKMFTGFPNLKRKKKEIQEHKPFHMYLPWKKT